MTTKNPGDKIPSSEWNSILQGLADGSQDVTGNSLSFHRRKVGVNFWISGLSVPASATLTTTISVGEAIVNGKYQNPASILHAFTPSKDTYVDLKDDGTFLYPEVTNGAAAPALSTNADGSDAFRIAGPVVTSATAITSSKQSGIDSLGNVILNTSPFGINKVLLPTLQNSWVNYDAFGGTHAQAHYFKDRTGMVYVRGLIKSGTVTAGTVLLNLPAGYRPHAKMLFASLSNGALCNVAADSNGNVTIDAGGNTAWLSLSTVSFMGVQ